MFAVLQSEAGQRPVRQYLSETLSKEWSTHVSLGHVSWDPIHGFILEDVFIEDQHQDTLFFIGELRAKLKLFDNTQHFAYLSTVSLDRVLVNFRQYAGESEFNYEFFIDALDGGPRDTTRAPIIW
ncbi:MAG: hypothetical protein LPK45_10055, partial [Bacteroidota bacterium]|nr:hypothetical protein [Bacteroidota bacterium]MDX5470163.1 hypothetical protein [Bacteroidota bacterium]